MIATGTAVMRDAGHHAIECRAVLGSVKARRWRSARSAAAALTDPAGSPRSGTCVMAHYSADVACVSIGHTPGLLIRRVSWRQPSLP